MWMETSGGGLYTIETVALALRCSQFNPQRIAGSGFEIAKSLQMIRSVYNLTVISNINSGSTLSQVGDKLVSTSRYT